MPAPAAANRAGANVGPKYHTKSAGAAPRTPLLMYAYSPKFEQAPCRTFPSLPGSTLPFDFEKMSFWVCVFEISRFWGGPHLKYKGGHRNPGWMGWIGVSAKGCVCFVLSEKNKNLPVVGESSDHLPQQESTSPRSRRRHAKYEEIPKLWSLT